MKTGTWNTPAKRSPRPTLGILDGCLDGVAYCMLHGWEPPFERPPSDLDIAIAPDHLEQFEGALAAANVRIMQLIQHEASAFYFVLTRHQSGDLCVTKLDATVDYRRDGRIFLTAADLLHDRHEANGIRVAAPEVEFAYLLVKKISKGFLPPHQRHRLSRLSEGLGTRALLVAQRMLGRRRGQDIIDCFARSDWASLEARLPALRRALRSAVLVRDPFNAIRYWGPEIYRRWRRWCRPTGLCVAFLGPDGAGKSTMIKHLARTLGSTAFRRVSVFHLRARLGQPREQGPVTDPHRNRPHPSWLSLLKVCYYAAAHSIGYWFIVRPRLVRSTLVLFDRYYDDLLVDPRRYRYGASMRFVRLARHFAHRPDLYFLLDVPEAQLLNRKQEVSPGELRRQRDAYRRLAIESPCAVTLDGSLPVEEVARRATDVLVEYLCERYANRRREWFGRDHAEETLRWLTSVLCSSPHDACFSSRAAPHGPGTPAVTIKTFAWLSLGDGRAYLIPLETRRAGLRALDLYNARSLRATLAKALLAAGLRFGMATRLVRTVRLVGREGPARRRSASIDMLQHLQSVLQREDLHVGISAGTPGVNRKPVLLVLDSDGRPLAYVKVGSSHISNAAVQRERETLHFLARHAFRSFSAPTVLHSGWWNGRYVLVQSASIQSGTGRSGDRTARYSDIPRELAALQTRWMSWQESGFGEDILSRVRRVPNKYYRDTLERAARTAEARLDAAQLPFHLNHGDFTSWNTRNGGGKLYVFDWEHSREAGLPAHDLLHFHFQEMRCVQRQDIEKIYLSFLRDSRLRATVVQHLAGIGLTATPVELLFFLYRLDRLADEAAEIRPGVPTFREFAMFGKLINLIDS